MADNINLNQDQISLAKLWSSEVRTLPKYRAAPGESCNSLETHWKLKYDNSVISHFLLIAQKKALLGCLEDQASRAHVLLAPEGGEFISPANMHPFMDRVKAIFAPQEEL